jgi:hypothetical protein
MGRVPLLPYAAAMTRSAPTKRGKTSTGKKSAAKKTASRKSPRFVRDLLARGEAAKPDAKGKLPLEATHVITSEQQRGSVTVKRVRFKLS